MFLVISASLHPTSRSRVMASRCADSIAALGENVEVFDLAERPLPLCDGASAYGDANVQSLAKQIEQATAIILASPVYNYDVNAVAKNAVELTGRAWTGKTVGMLLAAGGQGSYMSAMGLANSLMLDFRCIVLPRFVYATENGFENEGQVNSDLLERIGQLAAECVRVGYALSQKRA